MNKQDIAKVCHEVNRAYCQSIGDESQPTYEEAPQWQKDSALLGVGIHISNPNAGPEVSHVSWMQQKTEKGWKYGTTKNPELKEHPCMVEYNQLPLQQQSKDYLFRAVVHALTPHLT